MNPENEKIYPIQKVKKLVKNGRIDKAVEIVASYLNEASEDKYIDRLEEIIETVLSVHGGRTVIRFLIENLIIDIPSLLKNLSRRDSLLRYSFLLLLKTMVENEPELFLPYHKDLLNSDNPNVREAYLQLLIFMTGSEKKVDDNELIKEVAERLNDEKDFVCEKAIQTLVSLGKRSPSTVTKILTNFAKEISEEESLKEKIDNVLKSILTVEKIEEIVEEEGTEKEISVLPDDMKKDRKKILEEKMGLKKRELELKKKKIELEEKELQKKKLKNLALGEELEESQEKRDLEVEEIIEDLELDIKKQELKLMQMEIELKEKEKELEKKVKRKGFKIAERKKKELSEIKWPKMIEKEIKTILNEELELKKKELLIKKKELDLEVKKKELEEEEIKEKEKELKEKEDLLKKEKQLSMVELELRRKAIEEREKKILAEEAKRLNERLEFAEKRSELEKNTEEEENHE